MARIRSVHPGLFTDEGFVSCTPFARLLLIGLWTEADDQGVFEWKPVTLKMRILPIDNVDVGALLEELASVNAIKSYEHGGRQYGAIRNFRKYQRPKKPNFIHFMPSEFRTYVGLSDTGPEQVPQKGEKSPQMEDGGGKMEDVIPPRSLRERPPKGSSLPADWKPSQELRLYAEGKGLSQAETDQIAEEMRDWSAANQNRAIARKSDWDATFRGFVRRHAERNKSAKSGSYVPNGSGVYVKHGSESFDRWHSHYRRNNDPKQHEFIDKPGTEVHVPSLFPRS